MIDQHLINRLSMCPPRTSKRLKCTANASDSHSLSHPKSPPESKSVLERIAPTSARGKLLQRASIARSKQRFLNQCNTHHQIDQGLLPKCPLHVRCKGKMQMTLKRKSQTEENFLSVIVRILCLVMLIGHLVSHHSVLHARLEPLYVLHVCSSRISLRCHLHVLDAHDCIRDTTHTVLGTRLIGAQGYFSSLSPHSSMTDSGSLLCLTMGALLLAVSCGCMLFLQALASWQRAVCMCHGNFDVAHSKIQAWQTATIWRTGAALLLLLLSESSIAVVFSVFKMPTKLNSIALGILRDSSRR
jgi:hypothetical protein